MQPFAKLLVAVVLVGVAVSAEEYTTNWGAPVSNAVDSETLGRRGPTLLQDTFLLERLQVQNRERIPERVVHARGFVAKGEFTVTDSLEDLTVADHFVGVGKKTPMAVRFSTVAHGRDSPEFLRDPHGFAIKFYSQKGNHDIVGNNWPVFFIRDGVRFPDLVRAMKPNPVTNVVEWWRRYDFLMHYPESTHALSFLLDDAGIPSTHRHQHGFGINTFKLLNKNSDEVWVRFRWESRLGEQFLSDEEAQLQHFSGAAIDLTEAIDRGNYPRWDFYVQTISSTQLPGLNFTFDFCDTTKDWPVDQVPLRKVGEFVLNENVDSKFLDDDQIAFAPGRLVPGVAPASCDKLLQARLFSYFDAQRYRLGVNHGLLPINRPKCPFSDFHIDGAMNFQNSKGRSSQAVNYFPSSIGDLTEARPVPVETEVLGPARKERASIVETDEDYFQAGRRFRSFDSARKSRFAMRLAATLAEDGVTGDIRARWIAIWRKVDSSLPRLIEQHWPRFSEPSKLLEEDAATYNWLRAFTAMSGSRMPSGQAEL